MKKILLILTMLSNFLFGNIYYFKVDHLNGDYFCTEGIDRVNYDIIYFTAYYKKETNVMGMFNSDRNNKKVTSGYMKSSIDNDCVPNPAYSQEDVTTLWNTSLRNGNGNLIADYKAAALLPPPEPEPEPKTPIDKDTFNPDGVYNTSPEGTTTWTDSSNNYYSYNPTTGVLLVYDSQTNKSSAYNVGGGYVPGNSYNTGSLIKNFDKNPNNIDTTPVSQDCEGFPDLQTKMLCEINQGIKKVNQESDSTNSLNNLLKNLNVNTNKNALLLNNQLKNIDNLTSTQNTVSNNTNAKLTETNTKLSNVNSNLDDIQTTLNTIKDTTKGSDLSITNPDNTPLNLDNYFVKDESVNTNELDTNIEETDSLIDSFFAIFNTFSSNIQNSFTTIKTQIEDTQSIIINPTNIFNSIEVVNCPTTYEADFSTFGLGTKFVVVDYCHYMSYLQPIIYFFTYVSLMILLIIFTFTMIGVLL